MSDDLPAIRVPYNTISTLSTLSDVSDASTRQTPRNGRSAGRSAGAVGLGNATRLSESRSCRIHHVQRPFSAAFCTVSAASRDYKKPPPNADATNPSGVAESRAARTVVLEQGQLIRQIPCARYFGQLSMIIYTDKLVWRCCQDTLIAYFYGTGGTESLAYEPSWEAK